MTLFPFRFRRYAKCLSRVHDPVDLDDDLHAILTNAHTLAEKVIQNCDEWSEGRAYAYAVRSSLRKYNDAKLRIPNSPGHKG